jgi:hypothetical protein
MKEMLSDINWSRLALAVITTPVALVVTLAGIVVMTILAGMEIFLDW